jgi:hypothetical protein
MSPGGSVTTIDSRAGAEIFDQPFNYQAMAVVAAARHWATEVWACNEGAPVEFMDELPTATIGTEEERARRALLDAVHDLEHHARPAQRTRPPTLFDPPA